MNEDNFEEFLKKTAQSYNAPPARAPREEMWNAIQAKRASGPRVVYGGGALLRDLSERRFSSKVWLGTAAAAVLLIATGVGIGRWTATPGAQNPVAAANPQKTGQAPTQGSATTSATESPRTVASSVSGSDRSSPSPVSPARTNQQYRIDSSGGNGTRVPLSGPSSAASLTPAYQLAAVRHLSEAEALLTSFRTRSTTDQQMDAQLGSWARELLSNTRLLLDSPVANDPQRRPLLEDLELVLVQIVQLSPGSTPQDRELIEKTLQQDHVMTRLRTAIPAGSQRGS